MAETRIRLDKQVQKAPASKMVPLSDANGELQYLDFNLLVKAGETLTVLNSVEVVGGNLVIKYTAEDGRQQVVSTALNYSQTDIKVTDAKLDNPSSGVYRLLLTESDGSTFPVDLSALLAVVSQNTEFVVLDGNGTPQSPLRISLTDFFWNSIPRPELTEVYRDLSQGDSITLAAKAGNIAQESIKVYRNGMRQDQDFDYSFIVDGDNATIRFNEGFTDRLKEKVVVDYRPIPAAI
ncbi:hypothetical protein [Rurimicrobium arvi]|uniref:Uncharacterized protein n=1 Tax=Rurimicrobium arvi TaxID=2049916 RepID=A0ABP8MYV9_9BACT